MKVLLAAVSFASGISGLQRHAFNVVRCLLLREEVAEIHLVIAPWQRKLPEAAGLPADRRLILHVANVDRGSMQRNLWYWEGLPRLAARVGVDLAHLSYPMPLHRAALGCPAVVSLHDLYPYEIPANFGFPKFLVNRMVLRQCLRDADAIACVSDATLAMLKRYAGTAVWQKAVRIYNCVEPAAEMAARSPIPGWNREKLLLCVAQHRRNKNIAVLIRAFQRLLGSGAMSPEAKLVVIGMEGPESGKLRRMVAAAGLAARVHFLHGLSEPELQWCYRHCEAVVSPSLTEGFGLPIAEALLAGCRVVCSDIPAHREIADGHCRFVRLRDDSADALASAIAGILIEPKREPVPLPQLSAAVLARQYVALYRRTLKSPSWATASASDLDLTNASAGNAAKQRPASLEAGN